MKNDALSSGAEEAPSSGTAGMDSGSGVVSMRTSWENLGGSLVLCPPSCPGYHSAIICILLVMIDQLRGARGLGQNMYLAVRPDMVAV